MTRVVLASLAICAASAALEGLFAGRGVRRRFTELRLPPYSPPLRVWIGIGLLYYAACFVVLCRLLSSGFGSSLRTVEFVLLMVLMSVNVLWNYMFFRRKDVRASFLAGLPYGLVALALAAVLFQLDPVASWVFLPYVVYLGYATWWGYRLWRLNDQPEVRRAA